MQLYEPDGRDLARNVGEYLSDGLRRGEGALVIATPDHSRAFFREMESFGADPGAAVLENRLLILDAEETLSRFMVHGQPDWAKFERVAAGALRTVQTPDRPRLRGYGEMVGILWSRGEYAAAIRLEKFWNGLQAANSFSLFCAYPIDIFGAEFQIAAVDALLCAHNRFIPCGADGDLHKAVSLAIDEVLGRRAEGLKTLISGNFRPSWASLPPGEATILWLRSNLLDEADAILDRARQQFQAFQRLRQLSPPNGKQVRAAAAYAPARFDRSVA